MAMINVLAEQRAPSNAVNMSTVHHSSPSEKRARLPLNLPFQHSCGGDAQLQVIFSFPKYRCISVENRAFFPPRLLSAAPSAVALSSFRYDAWCVQGIYHSLSGVYVWGSSLFLKPLSPYLEILHSLYVSKKRLPILVTEHWARS